MLWRRSISPRGEVYKRYRMGPRTEPWGTPHKRESLSDSDTSIWTNWERSVKYDVNQSSALPLIPKSVDNRWSKIPRSTVSNAADRSSSRRTTHCWLSMERRMSFWTRTRAGLAAVILFICRLERFVEIIFTTHTHFNPWATLSI